MSEQWPAEGDLLNGRYRLLEPIGTGGMAVVWRARDESLERLVAVKVLNTDLAVDQRIRDLVRREARTAAQLTHPQSTPVYDYGESATPSGQPLTYVVMQLLEGEALDERLAAGPLPWQDAVRIGEQVARVLAATHGRGYIHGDVSPGNIVLTQDGVRLIDFGISENVADTEGSGLGGVFGTPPYVAPERLTGGPSQLASDVYSIGALLFEMFTGRPPHSVVTWADASKAQLAGIPLTLEGVPDLPDEVAELCLQCLDTEPDRRPAASEVAEELAAALAEANPPVRRAPRGRRQFPKGWPAIAVAALVAVGLLLVNCWPETAANHGSDGRPPGGAVVAEGQEPGGAGPGADNPDGTGDGRAQAGTGSAGTGPDGGANQAGTDPDAGAPGNNAGTSATPAPVPPNSAPPPPITFDSAVSAVFDVIDNGAAAATIRSNTAEILRAEVRNMTANRTADVAPTLNAIDNIRRKVTDGTRDGTISADAARQLTAALDNLARAVRAAEPQRG